MENEEKMKLNKHIHPKGSLTLQDVLQSVQSRANINKAGAIAVFIGVCRGENLEGEKVEGLELEAYEEKAEKTLTAICEDLEKREGIVAVEIHHMIGEFKVGEDLVYVAVAGSHREQVFPVLREAVEMYKHKAPIFKKEYVITKDGRRVSSWISEKKKIESN